MSEDGSPDDARTRSTTAAMISLLTQYLTTECSPSRAPDKFWASLATASGAPNQSLDKTLLRRGLRVWYAYFIGLQHGTVAGLSQLSPTDLAVVAEQIARVRPHPSVTRLFSHLSKGWRGRLHRKWFQSVAEICPTPLGQPPVDVCLSERAQVVPVDASPAPSSSMANSNPAGGEQPLLSASPYNIDHRDMRANPESLPPVYIFGSVRFEFDPRTEFAWPATHKLGLIFPPYFTGVIYKLEGKAWLKISFPGDWALCQLECWIKASETQHVVKELFGLHLTVRDQRRGILLSNHVFQKIKGSLELDGASPENIKQLVGDEAAEAYDISPSRMEELFDGQTKITRCLRMEIWPELDCPSRLRLRMEAAKLTAIMAQLFPGAG